MPNHTAISSVGYGVTKLPRRREISDNPTVRLDLDNEPQPDAICSLMPVLVDSPFWEKMDISKVPELVAEIAASSAY